VQPFSWWLLTVILGRRGLVNFLFFAGGLAEDSDFAGLFFAGDLGVCAVLVGVFFVVFCLR
jgi:hypothetical protein